MLVAALVKNTTYLSYVAMVLAVVALLFITSAI